MSSKFDYYTIRGLIGIAETAIDSARNDYNARLAAWDNAIKRFVDAYNYAFNNFDDALRISSKLKMTVLEISFFVFTILCGKGLDWIQSILMQREDLFQKDARKLFGDISNVLNSSLKPLLKDQVFNKLAFQMPAPFSKYDPFGLKTHLEKVFSNQRQSISDYLAILKENLRSSEGADIISNMVGSKSLNEAEDIIRWIFDIELRRDVLGKSYYYNNRPCLPSDEEMANRIELCMWAETFKANNPVPPEWLLSSNKGATPGGILGTAFGTTLETIRIILYKPGSSVEKRLIALGIMSPKGKFRNERHPSYPLDNFGNYTNDDELMQLRLWAYSYQPVAIGGPMDQDRAISSPRIWNDFRNNTLPRL